MNAMDKHIQYARLPLRNISLSGGVGATLKMWKQDYMDRSRYNFTEHRHAVSASDVAGLTIESLRIENSGGDGLDLAGALRDVTIRSIVASNNCEYSNGRPAILQRGC